MILLDFVLQMSPACTSVPCVPMLEGTMDHDPQGRLVCSSSTSEPPQEENRIELSPRSRSFQSQNHVAFNIYSLPYEEEIT